MPAPPDQFQRRTYVRLPFADEYLERRDEKLWKEEFRRAFTRPLLTVRIADPLADSPIMPGAGEKRGRRHLPPTGGRSDEEAGAGGVTPR